MLESDRLRSFLTAPAVAKVSRLVMAILLLVAVAWFVDIKAAWLMLKDTDWRWVVLALVVVQLQIVMSALRWQMTAVRLGQSLNKRRAISEYYLATMANLSLPGGVAGDAARVIRNKASEGYGQSAQAVILERLSGQLALFLVALIGFMLWPVIAQDTIPDSISRLLLTVAMIVVVIIAMIAIVIHVAAERVTRFIVSFGPAIHRAWLSDRQWLVQGPLSLAVVATYLTVFAVSALAVGQPLPVIALLTVVPFVLLSMVVPVSIGGWGIREATAASLWPFLGLPPESGVVTSVVYGLVSMVGALPGIVWLTFSPGRRV